MTKQTLKVLTGMALAGTLVATGAHNADAKVYRPEMKVENGKYFVRTSDESAKGKAILVAHSDNNTFKGELLYGTAIVFAPTEDPTQYKEIPSFVGIQESDLIVVRDGENIGNEETLENPEVREKDKKEFIENKVTVKTALENGKVGKQKTQTPTTPQTSSQTQTTPQTTQPQQSQNKNRELVKDQKQKQEGAKKVEETQKQQTPQVEKKDTTKKPLPKTNVSSNTGLATFGGLSLISLMVFLGLRKKQK